MGEQGILKKSFTIINAGLIFVLAVFFLDVLFARWISLGFKAAAFFIIIPAKVYVLGGVIGVLAEIASGETLVSHWAHFKNNAKRYWKFVAAFYIALLLGHSLFYFIGWPFPRISFEAFSVYFHGVGLIVLSYLIIKDKYADDCSWSVFRRHYAVHLLATVLAVYFIYLILFNIPANLPPLFPGLSRLFWAAQTYVFFLLYAMGLCVVLQQNPYLPKKFVSDKEIYLINPLGGGLAFHLSSYFLRAYPPIFAVIRALTPQGYSFREFNRRAWRKNYYAPEKLIAITCFTSNAPEAYKIAKGFQEAGSKVVMGGPHVSYLPEEALNYCDSVVTGEVEGVWEELVSDYEQGRLKPVYHGVATHDCHERIQSYLLQSPPEIIKDVLEATRGCKFHCKFCAVPSLSSGQVRKKSIEDLIALLTKIKGRYRHVTFIDNNIYNDPAYAKELFSALKPLGIQWSTQCTIDIAQNDAMLRLAKESGCENLLIGFEITEGSFEKAQGGKLSMVDKYYEYARKIKKAGIRIKGHFIFGFESDRLRGLWRFWKTCLRIHPHTTVLSLLTPFPGARLYADMAGEDRITNLNWRDYGAQSLVFSHGQMNSALLRGLWPFIYLFFLLTTSSIGHVLGAALIACAVWPA